MVCILLLFYFFMEVEMEQKIKRKKYTAVALAIGLMWSGLSSAALTNGDFSSGFNGWEGEVTDLSFPTPVTTAVSPLPGSFSNNYTTPVSGGALLTTTTLDNDIWSVGLFQDFSIDSISAGSTLQLSLDIAFSLSDTVGDFILAELSNSSSTLDISAGGIFDITSWGGTNATLSFLVEDIDDISDSLSIANIAITEIPATVPEPTTVLLISAGLLAMRRKFF